LRIVREPLHPKLAAAKRFQFFNIPLGALLLGRSFLIITSPEFVRIEFKSDRRPDIVDVRQRETSPKPLSMESG
jgi:hypothetical protein